MEKEKSKEVKMNSEGNEKLTYEQLEKFASDLHSSYKQLQQKYWEASRVIAEFNEIGLLLEILDKAAYFNDSFVTRCSGKVEEIVNAVLDKAEKQEDKGANA